MMGFHFYSPTKHTPLHSESTLVGCEVWIDVSRFCAIEKSVHQATGTSTQSSLSKSFADLRKKFRKSLGADIG